MIRRNLLKLAGTTAALAPFGCVLPAMAQGSRRFDFDLLLEVDLESDRVSGRIALHVNSADGTMALANSHVTLWALGMPDLPDVDVHHVVQWPGGALLCGRHPMVGQACLPFGAAPSGLGMLTGEALARDFFASYLLFDQDNAPVDIAGTEGLALVHGRGADGTMISLWFDPGRSTVSGAPFIGPGVGIVQDYAAGHARVVRHAFFDFATVESPVRWLAMRLISLRQTAHRIDVSAYPVIDLFSMGGLAGANALGQAGRPTAMQVRAFEEMGDRNRADATEAAYLDRVRRYANARGLPM